MGKLMMKALENGTLLGVRCAICKVREAVSYWKEGKPYCRECKAADPVQWEPPRPKVEKARGLI